MSDLAIFVVGAYTSVLCAVFVGLTIREVRVTERELERHAQASPSGSPASPPSAPEPGSPIVSFDGP